ncbi:hypothetical protein MNBD_GAMMA15-2322 [hydrothermal vent metagenome]|uniref:Uncharacterized protein n=1 Tax=hydrothermal vent metagenome TaxID=652676 RepID=A0A3B0YZM3_9ZZZZ
MKMKKAVSMLTAAMMLCTSSGISLADDVEPGVMLYFKMPLGETPRVMKQKSSFGLRADYDMRRITNVAGHQYAGYQAGSFQPMFDTAINLKGSHSFKLHGMQLNYSEGSIAGSSGDSWLKASWQTNPLLFAAIAVVGTGLLMCVAEVGMCNGDNNNNSGGGGSPSPS